MGLTFPQNPWLDGELVTAAKLNSFNTAIQQKFGNIVNEDIASDANIDGSKLAVSTLPGDRIVGKSIATAQLGLLSVTNAEIFDGTIKKGKVATATGDRLTRAQLEILVQTVPFGDTVSGGAKIAQATPVTPIPTATYDILAVYLSGAPVRVAGQHLYLYRTTSGANHVAQVVAEGANGSFSGNVDIVYAAKT